MASSIDQIEDIRNIYFLLQHNIKSNDDKMSAQYKIYSQFHKIFQKTSMKLSSLANTINQQVLKLNNQQEYLVQYYQMLSNSILRIADSSSRVSLRCKSEIIDSIKTFNENYQNIYQDLTKRITSHISEITNLDHQQSKSKDNYYQACQKFEKHKEMQRKVMEKIESGSKSQLQKLNSSTKKFTESIEIQQNLYQNSVAKLNKFWLNTRNEFMTTNQSISYNETTRISFFKKTIVNSIKTLQQFNNAYEPDTIKKMQEVTKQETRNQELAMKKMKHLFQKIINSKYKEEFISYEEMIKMKNSKNKQVETHLVQHFSKIKEKDKRVINDLITNWFISSKKFHSPIKEECLKDRQLQKRRNGSFDNEKSIKKHEEKMIRQLDQVKQKIMSQPNYSFYFIQLLHENIVQMTSFYCKLNQDHFIYILNAFTVITKNLDIHNEIGIEFIYKMMIISLRVMLKKSKVVRERVNQPIELLCEKYGKNALRIREPKVLLKLLGYLQKRKVSKKKNVNDSKSSLNTFAKGLFSAFKKNPILTEQQIYNCLEELIKIIANFSMPNEIIFPFIKQTLGNNQQSAYEYLKGIILNKKDVQQRQSLFFRKEIKEKKEELFKKAVQNKKMASYAINIVAQRGFLGRQELPFRIICSELKNVHLEILYNLKIPTEKKWIRLIPVDKKLSYIQMKQEVAEKSVPSATEQIITLDVNRSLHLHGEFLNPTILHSLLRIYAYFHQDISYCQGMNYLAGYLYIKTMNEQYTYRIFEYIMQVRFKEIFLNEFQVLKIKMYQFQRLLAIFHPEISDHFKRQSISPECYIVSWIITLFASSYQYTLSSYIIDFLWQRFIIRGWPQFFKFVLWIFSLHKEDLIELTYDKALHFLGELSRTEFFLSNEQKYRQKFSAIENPMAGMERYPISQQLLNKFIQEYKLDK